MIKVYKNPNFSKWFNVSLFGIVVDQASTSSEALMIAKELQLQDRCRGVMIYLSEDLSPTPSTT